MLEHRELFRYTQLNQIIPNQTFGISSFYKRLIGFNLNYIGSVMISISWNMDSFGFSSLNFPLSPREHLFFKQMELSIKFFVAISNH